MFAKADAVGKFFDALSASLSDKGGDEVCEAIVGVDEHLKKIQSDHVPQILELLGTRFTDFIRWSNWQVYRGFHGLDPSLHCLSR